MRRPKKERILCAATWYKDLPLIMPEVLQIRGYAPYNVHEGIVFSGWRHTNCLYQMVAITGKRDCEVGRHIQGFLTNFNRFVDRKEAGEIAYSAKQTKNLHKHLFSEDLY
jgi:alpha-D-ribose 1-methylphosphonate 5-triphosphate synthase subunit PhnL